MKKLLSIILTIALLLTLAPLNTQAAKPKITYKKLTMITGSTFSGLYLDNAFQKSMKSSNKKVVAVTEYGDLKAKKAGTATITIKDYNNKAYKCKVTVYDKKDIINKLSLERITFSDEGETFTYYLLTNNSPLMLDIDVDIAGKKLTGEIDAEEDGCYGIPKGGKYLLYAGDNCTTATFKFKVSASTRKDVSSNISINLKKQSHDALITLKNSGSKEARVNAVILGYDSSGTVIYASRYFTYLQGHDSEQNNLYYPSHEEKTYDEEDGWDWNEVYDVPARFETYVYATEF